MSAEIRSARVRVRDLEFDPQARSVVVRGHETLLDSRSASVLLALVERLGQRVGKDELLGIAWPNQVVHENSLAKAISKLRRVIRGSGLEIAVSYGSGYTLRETVGAEEEAGSDRSASDSAPPERARTSFGYGRAAALFAICLAGAAALAIANSWAGYPVRSTPPITNDRPDAMATILWVDDHPSNNQLDVEAFKKRRIAVHLAESTEDALALLRMNSYRLVISDLGRGEDRLAGLKMIQRMKQEGIGVPVIIYTVRPDTRSGQEAQRRLVAGAGASDLAVTPTEVRAEVFKRVNPSG